MYAAHYLDVLSHMQQPISEGDQIKYDYIWRVVKRLNALPGYEFVLFTAATYVGIGQMEKWYKTSLNETDDWMDTVMGGGPIGARIIRFCKLWYRSYPSNDYNSHVIVADTERLGLNFKNWKNGYKSIYDYAVANGLSTTGLEWVIADDAVVNQIPKKKSWLKRMFQ